MQLLFVLLIVVILAQLLAELCKLVKIPRVIGHITAGIILGIPYFQSWIFTSQSMDIIRSLADIGTILLFFFVGLEINLLQFEKNINESLKISLLNTAIPFILGFILSQALGLTLVKSLIIGVCLAVSAQSISIDFLEEMKLIKSRIGQLIITAGAVDDVVELLLISAVLAAINTAIGGTSILMLLGGVLLFIVIIIISRIYILPQALKLFEKGKDQTSLFTGALIITLLMAAFSEKMGLGSLMGALIGGVLVRQILLKKGARVEEETMTNLIRVISFGFLVPIFFVWVGLNTNVTDIIDNLWFTIAITLIAFAGTIGGTILGVLWSKGTKKEGLIVGWGVNPKGDVELVIASLALQKGIFNTSDFSAVIFMAFVTTLISPIVFRWLIKDYHEKHFQEHNLLNSANPIGSTNLPNNQVANNQMVTNQMTNNQQSLQSNQLASTQTMHSEQIYKTFPSINTPLDEEMQVPQTIDSAQINIIYASKIPKNKVVKKIKIHSSKKKVKRR